MPSGNTQIHILIAGSRLGERLTAFRVDFDRRYFHLTRAVLNIKDKGESCGSAKDDFDSWCRVGDPRCRKLWYDKEVELSSSGLTIVCHEKSSKLPERCPLCPPKRILLKRTPQDLHVCAWDCVPPVLPPCYIYVPSFWDKTKAVLLKVPRLLFILFLCYWSYEGGIWSGPSVTTSKLMAEFNEAITKKSEIPAASTFTKTCINSWNKLIAHIFSPLSQLLGSSVWSTKEEEVINIEELSTVPITELDALCEVSCEEQLCERDISAEELAKLLEAWPVYRDEETYRNRKEMDELRYDRIPPGGIGEHAYANMPDFDLIEGKCDMYEDEEKQKAEAWFPPKGSCRPVCDRPCLQRTTEGLRQRVAAKRALRVKEKYAVDCIECPVSKIRDAPCMCDSKDCKCPAFIKGKSPPDKKLQRCVKTPQK